MLHIDLFCHCSKATRRGRGMERRRDMQPQEQAEDGKAAGAEVVQKESVKQDWPYMHRVVADYPQ